MIKFSHIDAFYIVARYAKEYLPVKVKFRGTTKLHGTNCSVVCTPKELLPQSRNRRITPGGGDNMGFAGFITQDEQVETLRAIESQIRHNNKIPADDPLTIYGEWCGPGIQNGVAIQKLPERHWVVFAAKVGAEDGKYVDVAGATRELPNACIDSVHRASVYGIDVDFSDQESIEAAAQFTETLTASIEACCPFAKLYDIEGMGEGIVWVPMEGHWGNSDLFFKTKGDKHKQVQKAKRNKAVTDPEVIKSIDAFVDYAVTENRLQQGIEAIKEMGLPVDMKSTGEYLKWVGQDVKRECRLELQDNDLDWKQVSKAVTTKARGFFAEKAKAL